MIKGLSIKNLNLTWIFAISMPVFVLALFLLRFSPQKQFIIFFIATVVYLGIALIHHFREKTLIFEIVIEYILIAVLALIVIQSLIL